MTEERLEVLMLAIVERHILLFRHLVASELNATDDLVAQLAAAADRRMILG